MDKDLLFLEDVLSLILSIQHVDERVLFLLIVTMRLKAYNHTGQNKEEFTESIRETLSTNEDMLETSEKLFKLLFPE